MEKAVHLDRPRWAPMGAAGIQHKLDIPAMSALNPTQPPYCIPPPLTPTLRKLDPFLVWGVGQVRSKTWDLSRSVEPGLAQSRWGRIPTFNACGKLISNAVNTSSRHSKADPGPIKFHTTPIAPRVRLYYKLTHSHSTQSPHWHMMDPFKFQAVMQHRNLKWSCNRRHIMQELPECNRYFFGS
eukprot:2540432-Amphidinium_carterae.1